MKYIDEKQIITPDKRWSIHIFTLRDVRILPNINKKKIPFEKLI